MESTIDLHRLATYIQDIKFCMFSTVGDDGAILSRPMANQDIDEDSFTGRVWFFTKKDTAKVHSIERDAHVNLAYSDSKNQRYVSIAGKAFINLDKEMMKELWTPILRAWFPEGLEDPELCLIGVDIESAEVWDAPPGTVVQAAGFIKSVLTGRPYPDKLHTEHYQGHAH